MQKIHIVVDSVTGTSREYARNLCDKLQSNWTVHFHEYATLDDIITGEPQTLLFFVANTGEGEFPPYLRRIYLQLTRQQYLLPDCEYLILNFGDSRYKEFGTAGHLLDEALQNADAKRLGDVLTFDAFNNNRTEVAVYDWVLKGVTGLG